MCLGRYTEVSVLQTSCLVGTRTFHKHRSQSFDKRFHQYYTSSKFQS